MKDILDQELDSVSLRKNTFAKLALGAGSLCLVALITLFALMPIHFTASVIPARTLAEQMNYRPPIALFVLIYISSLLGLIFSVFSMARDEKWTYFKALAIALNLLLFVLLLGVMIFALLA